MFIRLMLICVVLSVLSCSQKDNVNDLSKTTEFRTSELIIGEVVEGKYVVTANRDSLKIQLTRFINATEDLFSPVESISITSNDDNYYLSAVGENHSTSVGLKLIGDKFYELDGGGSCTCSGCKSTGQASARECIANKEPEGCWCSACSSGDCSKTSSALLSGETIFK